MLVLSRSIANSYILRKSFINYRKNIVNSKLSISTIKSEGMNKKSIHTRIWDYYNTQLEKYPLLTKCITSGLISFFADIICQVCFEKDSKIVVQKDDIELLTMEGLVIQKLKKFQNIDWYRLFTFSLIGTAFVGPSLHYWYGFLARRIPGNHLIDALYRLSLDQFVFAPLFIPSFYCVALLLEGKPEKIPEKLKNDWFSTVVTNYAVWVPAQFINFRLIHPNYQVLFSNLVGFFWNIYLSHQTYSEKVVVNTKKV